MIFRKPYAFLIKNFRKIHIFLLVLALFVFYKQNQISSFVKEYISLGSYSYALESIGSKIDFWLYFALVLILVSSILLMWLLLYKKKPWKAYLIVLFEYILMFVSFVMVKNFFESYSVTTTVSGVYAARDLLRIAGILQYIVFLFLIIRIMGVDLNKFSFNTDKEFLELNSSDKEEFEISIDVDRHSLIRTFNKLKRNIFYFYIEHKYVCNIILVALVLLVLGYSYYNFGIVHKSYKENDTLNTGIYNITIKNSYITNKDLGGNKIENGSKFVILDVVMRNNTNKPVEPNFNRFHLINADRDFTYTIYYNNYFEDLGKPINAKMSINGQKEKHFYMVFNVDEELKDNKFILYYQELGGKGDSYLRKIKLKIKNISDIVSDKKFGFGDTINFKYINNMSKELSVNSASFVPTSFYKRHICSIDGCFIQDVSLTAPTGYQLLRVDFSSSDFEGVDFVDFSRKYGRIKYESSDGKDAYYDMIDAVGLKYEGKEAFFKVKDEIVNSNKISLVYVLRNKRYTITIK